ncbi:MAG: hypothetical protein AB7V62_03810 [Thermoleophilia bacterium]
MDHLLGGDADAPNRIGKVSAGEIAGGSPAEIAAVLAREIDGTCAPAGCASGLVAVDEITGRFADGTAAGRNLRDAMAELSKRTHRSGGTYADRVHFYLGPGVVTAIGYGLGPDHDLGRNGITKRAGYVTVMEGLARAGGVSLEMYRPGTSGAGAVHTLERSAWESGPRDVAQLLGRFGGSLDRVHLLMSNPGVPQTMPELPGRRMATPADFCTTMDCVWGLATDPATINPRLVQNGVGEYQLGSRAVALDWLRGFNAAMAAPPPAQPDSAWLARFREGASPAVGGLRRIGPPRKPRAGVVAVRLQTSARMQVTFRIGARYARQRTVLPGTRTVTFPIPRCGSCTVMKVSIVAGGTVQDTFRIAALAADRAGARR